MKGGTVADKNLLVGESHGVDEDDLSTYEHFCTAKDYCRWAGDTIIEKSTIGNGGAAVNFVIACNVDFNKQD